MDPTTPLPSQPHPALPRVSPPPSPLLIQRKRSDKYRKRSLQRTSVAILRQMFRELAAHSSTDDNTVDKLTLLKYMPLPGLLGERLFGVFDSDKSSSIDFHEFFTGLAIVYGGTPEDKKRFLFEMYDLDGNGEITREELAALLYHIPGAFRLLGGRKKTEQEANDRVAELTKKRIQEIVESAFENVNGSGLNFEQFVLAIDKRKEILEVLNLFYGEAMPELPLGCDNLDPSLVPKTSADPFYRRVRYPRRTFPSSISPVRPASPCPCSTTGVAHSESQREPSDSLPRSPLQRLLPLRSTPAMLFASTSSIPPSTSSTTAQASNSTLDYGSVWRVLPCPMCRQEIRVAHCPKCGSLLGYKETDEDNGVPSCVSCPWSLTDIKYCYGCGQPLQSQLASLTHGEDVPHQSALKLWSEPSFAAFRRKDDTLVLAGWLFKVGHRLGRWTKRFYVLRDRFLYYYPGRRSETPKGVYFLQNCLINLKCYTGLRDHRAKYGIDIAFTNGKTRSLYATSAKDQDTWFQHLLRASMYTSVHDVYSLQEEIGRGKFSVVYRATCKKTREEVAIKILSKACLSSDGKELLRTEVSVLKLLKHPNVTSLVDVFDSSDYLYLALEWVTGGDLAHFLGTVMPWLSGRSPSSAHPVSPESAILSPASVPPSPFSTPPEAHPSLRPVYSSASACWNRRFAIPNWVCTRILRGVLRGLQYIHTKGVVHRDLKPENILLQTKVGLGEIKQWLENGDRSQTDIWDLIVDSKVADFGLSKILAPTWKTAERLGTLAYAAPEVLEGRPYEKSVDMWSIGVITYELLSGGSLPFARDTDQGIAEAIMKSHYKMDSNFTDVSEAGKVRRLRPFFVVNRQGSPVKALQKYGRRNSLLIC